MSMRQLLTGNLVLIKAEMLREKCNIPSEKSNPVEIGCQYFYIEGELAEAFYCGTRQELWIQKGVEGRHSRMRTAAKLYTIQIYNQDETSFIYQLLSKLTYLAPNGNTKEAKGTNSMRSKIVLLLGIGKCCRWLCVISLFIGSAKRPKFFGLVSKDMQTKLKTI